MLIYLTFDIHKSLNSKIKKNYKARQYTCILESNIYIWAKLPLLKGKKDIQVPFLELVLSENTRVVNNLGIFWCDVISICANRFSQAQKLIAE